MSFRNILIESKSVVTYENNLLKIKTDKDHFVPVEDINAVMFDNKTTMISINALIKLSEAGSAVFICNEKHMPCALMSPFGQKRKSSEVVRLQDELTMPKKKKLWQAIVISKVINQSICLSLVGDHIGANYLCALSNAVRSGDVENIEAVAANYYFRRLFGQDFCRTLKNNPINIALNYGYAIIRGHIARLLASYGFIPMKGIHHRSCQNSFNLADDFIEPFRAVVDLYVAKYLKPVEEISCNEKRKLLELLNADMILLNNKYSVMNAVEMLVQSFLRICKKESDTLNLPTLIDYELHQVR